MPFEARFLHGDPLMVDYTPGAAVAAGTVVVQGSVVGVAHNDIAANALGALAIGGGVYEFAKASGGSTAIGVGVQVYWDDTNNVATATASSHKKLGMTVKASVDADTVVRVALGQASG